MEHLHNVRLHRLAHQTHEDNVLPVKLICLWYKAQERTIQGDVCQARQISLHFGYKAARIKLQL